MKQSHAAYDETLGEHAAAAAAAASKSSCLLLWGTAPQQPQARFEFSSNAVQPKVVSSGSTQQHPSPAAFMNTGMLLLA
jgi:hypothetical protein